MRYVHISSVEYKKGVPIISFTDTDISIIGSALNIEQAESVVHLLQAHIEILKEEKLNELLKGE